MVRNYGNEHEIHVFHLSGANFTNAVVDRVAFDNSDLSNTTFTNAVITGELPLSAKPG
jgi:uncharacterized protein YjbI with pentapeptide repeats